MKKVLSLLAITVVLASCHSDSTSTTAASDSTQIQGAAANAEGPAAKSDSASRADSMVNKAPDTLKAN